MVGERQYAMASDRKKVDLYLKYKFAVLYSIRFTFGER